MSYISFQPKDYFNTKLYTGTGATNAQTSVGFQSDWVWIQNRGGTYANVVYDAVRGATKQIEPQGTGAEATVSDTLTSFDSDGFTLGADSSSYCNRSSSPNTYVAWNWKANGAGSSNTDGSITSTVSANTTSGFSIIKYTGTGSNASIGTGLGAIPHMAIFKRTDTAGFNWFVYHRSLGAGKFIILDSSGAEQSSTSIWQNTTPTSSVITLGGDGGVNASGGTYICYAFTEKKGFSAMGSYVGNGSTTDGSFIYTGMKPSFVMYKNTSVAGGHWQIHDTKRLGYNGANKVLRANLTNAEADDEIDILSNGFKARNASNNNNNWSGVTYLYMAFAEEPLVSSNGVPAVAR